MRWSSRRRNSASSSGPLGRFPRPSGAGRDRPAGWRAIALSAAVAVEYQLKSAPAAVPESAWAVTQDLVRHDRRAMSHATAPTTNVAAMMPIQVLFVSRRNSAAGVSAASVRQ